MSVEKVSLKALASIQHPIITEKSQMVTENNCYVFAVRCDASKPEIKEAIESLFSVKVQSINTLIQKGKRKVFKGITGKRSNQKKAYIKLEKGQSIELGVNG
jgi:large subunit ribosomal protein L23